ncbi:polysaccharide deacetylase family protein [Streptomyces sp. NBC_01187]|uniref:polysaccharide deacetylase family protein n=1 Tax=Streptomyces sp. NBC_01187 TaxID=2903766 RepID=UPI002F90F11F|nr:polysaccharide deacetylase family protein [Streptomyces sp. NBC_01187]WSS46943.1 polysaccharide deacetylase family protein [Streptomyces sp. NBC_01187]
MAVNGMKPTERIDYDPIEGRRPLRLPGGAKVAVWLIVNIEEWSDTEPMPRTVLTPPAGGVPSPDVPNWSWHEYGNRVGFWRMLRVIDRHRIPAALAVNGSAVAAYPQITEAALSRRWEFLGHGFSQKNMQKVPDERRDIRSTGDAIAAATGKAPRGWLGPGLTETWETPDLLVEEGYEYVCDWVLDDQPTQLRTRTDAIVNVPYTQECNDVAMMLIQHHTADEYRQRATDQFDQLLADARADDSARVMALVVHPYIMGAPHRLKYLDLALEHIRGHDEAAFCTGEQIHDWYTTQCTAPATDLGSTADVSG